MRWPGRLEWTQAMYDALQAMHGEGVSQRTIAQRLGCTRDRVRYRGAKIGIYSMKYPGGTRARKTRDVPETSVFWPAKFIGRRGREKYGTSGNVY